MMDRKPYFYSDKKFHGPPSEKHPEKSMRFLTRAVVGTLLYMAIIGIACLVYFMITGLEPVALIGGIFGGGGLQLIMTTMIEIFDKRGKQNAD